MCYLRHFRAMRTVHAYTLPPEPNAENIDIATRHNVTPTPDALALPVPWYMGIPYNPRSPTYDEHVQYNYDLFFRRFNSIMLTVLALK